MGFLASEHLPQSPFTGGFCQMTTFCIAWLKRVLVLILERQSLDGTNPRKDISQTRHFLDWDQSQTRHVLDWTMTFPRFFFLDWTNPRRNTAQIRPIPDSPVLDRTFSRQEISQTEHSLEVTYHRITLSFLVLPVQATKFCVDFNILHAIFSLKKVLCTVHSQRGLPRILHKKNKKTQNIKQ